MTVNKKQTRSSSKHYLGFTLRSTNQKSTDEQDEVPQENDEHYIIIATSSLQCLYTLPFMSAGISGYLDTKHTVS